MSRMSIVRSLATSGPALILSVLLGGCGSSNEAKGPEPIPVVNPDPNPNYSLKGVTLENEAQNVDRLRAVHNTPPK